MSNAQIINATSADEETYERVPNVDLEAVLDANSKPSASGAEN